MKESIRTVLKNILKIETNIWLGILTFMAASVLVEDIHGAYQEIKDALKD